MRAVFSARPFLSVQSPVRVVPSSGARHRANVSLEVTALSFSAVFSSHMFCLCARVVLISGRFHSASACTAPHCMLAVDEPLCQLSFVFSIQ
jgi:hypothetical protein